MRKVIASMNITLDGFCDHIAGIADEQLHDHYTDVLKLTSTKTFDSGVILLTHEPITESQI